MQCDGVSGLLIQALRAEGVEYVVAPYEADAQMTYLAITGRVHAVITEDSDMLPYGCPRVGPPPPPTPHIHPYIMRTDTPPHTTRRLSNGLCAVTGGSLS